MIIHNKYTNTPLYPLFVRVLKENSAYGAFKYYYTKATLGKMRDTWLGFHKVEPKELHNILTHAFYWKETSQGHKFWRNIALQLENLETVFNQFYHEQKNT